MISFILNFPYTIVGLIAGFISIPQKVKFNKDPYAVIIDIKNFWWGFGYMKNTRAMAIGNIILLSPKIYKGDLAHEIVHIKQHNRAPIYPPVGKGSIKKVDKDGTVTLVGNVACNEIGEGGLLGIALQPGFDPTNPDKNAIYVYCTIKTTGNNVMNQVARYDYPPVGNKE